MKGVPGTEAATSPYSGLLNAIVGKVKAPPAPLPVVTTLPLTFTHPFPGGSTIRFAAYATRVGGVVGAGVAGIIV